MKGHPWHDVSYGDKAPEVVRGIVEIPKNSRAKYELDKVSGSLILDRVLYSSINYPANYGFIPQTLGKDGDPLDILVISQIEIVPLCIVEARVIGVMPMIDQGEEDDKLIAVAVNDMSVNHITELSELAPHAILELKSFFEDYKKLEKKTVSVDEIRNKTAAHRVIEEGIQDYKNEFN
jgi:inorganic pyrophosphatase